MIVKDTSGRTLAVAQEVAYNKEGCVVRGRITAIKTRKQYGKTKPLVLVELLSDYWGEWHPRGHISKVTNPSSILVLYDPADAFEPGNNPAFALSDLSPQQTFGRDEERITDPKTGRGYLT